MRRRRPLLRASAVAMAALALAACADDTPGTTITVHGGPDVCSASEDTGEGPLLFWVINDGDVPATFSLYDSEGQLVTDVKDVETGMTKGMAANVYDGEFELRCESTDGGTTSTTITVPDPARR